MRLAIKTAKESTERFKHGAVIVSSGSVLGFYPNKFRNNPRTCAASGIDCLSVHAEAGAISSVRSPDKLRGSTLYVARVNKRGEARASAPCSECAKLIRKVGIRKVVYT